MKIFPRFPELELQAIKKTTTSLQSTSILDQETVNGLECQMSTGELCRNSVR